MLIIELPILIPTEDSFENQNLGIHALVELEPTCTTFYIPATERYRVTKNPTNKKQCFFILGQDEAAFDVNADYETTNRIIQDAIKSQQKISFNN